MNRAIRDGFGQSSANAKFRFEETSSNTPNIARAKLEPEKINLGQSRAQLTSTEQSLSTMVFSSVCVHS